MKNRCNPKTKTEKSRKNYVLRGIAVCSRWINSFGNFLADMGECPAGMELDRKNNTKGYEPSNCKWSTHKENQANKQKILSVTIGGETKTLAQLSKETGLDYQLLRYRFKTGWGVDCILEPAHRKAI